MRGLPLVHVGERLRILCLGAHSDDIEIGAGATVLGLLEGDQTVDVHWYVLSGAGGARQREAEASAADFLAGANSAHVEVRGFRDGFFPQDGEAIKTWFETLKKVVEPDYIFTHACADAHQDHREVSRLTWNTFRDHCVFEYEIPKWDGDLGRPNLYIPASEKTMARKVELLERHFGSQRSKHWFDRETFRGLARLRGMECRAPERYAEAFYAHKLLVV